MRKTLSQAYKDQVQRFRGGRAASAFLAKVLCFNGEGSEAKDGVLNGLRCRGVADRPWTIDIILGEVEIMEKS